MGNIVYSSVPQEENKLEVGSKEEGLCQPLPHSSQRRLHFALVIGGVFLFSSILINSYFIHQQFLRPWDLVNTLPSRYAHLRRDVPVENVPHSDFDSLNRTIQDAAWDDWRVEPWQQFVALDEDYTIEVGLPHAQRWPWDDSKGTYILTGAHELHCVRVLRTHVNENHDGVPEEQQIWHYGHLMHCINVLRETVMCNADDTPLYTGHLHANAYTGHTSAGLGTIKMCRNWDALLEWSRARSACYRPVHWYEKYPESERYKYCPDGSRPWEEAKY